MKRQSRKVGVAGGFFNQLMGNNSSEPKVGEGATILMYSDRYPYEVISVSEDGSSCVIRSMDTKYVGSGYGDESYEYFSNKDNPTKTLEWDDKKSCWGEVTYRVELIRALSDRLWKEHGFDMWKNLPNGLTRKDIVDGEENGAYTQYKLIKGVTKEYRNFHKISILFGSMDKYVDPSF